MQRKISRARTPPSHKRASKSRYHTSCKVCLLPTPPKCWVARQMNGGAVPRETRTCASAATGASDRCASQHHLLCSLMLLDTLRAEANHRLRVSLKVFSMRCRASACAWVPKRSAISVGAIRSNGVHPFTEKETAAISSTSMSTQRSSVLYEGARAIARLPKSHVHERRRTTSGRCARMRRSEINTRLIQIHKEIVIVHKKIPHRCQVHMLIASPF